MKVLLFSLFTLLFSQWAWSQQVIEQPEYRFRNTGISRIEKVELSPEYTKIHLLSEFIPGWWVMFQQAEIALESKNPAFRLSPISLEGAKWGEKKGTPKEGIDRFVITFPPLPAGTESFDFIDATTRIADVRVKGTNTLPAFEGIPQELIGNWFSNEKGWEYGFYEQVAILKEDFYTYRKVEKKGKWWHIWLENKKKEPAEVWVKAGKEGKYLIGEDHRSAKLYTSTHTSPSLRTAPSGEEFFQAGQQTTLRGIIRGYDPKYAAQTMELILYDAFDLNQVHAVVEFQDNGTFEVSFYCGYPRTYEIQPGNNGFIPVYCEPGKTTMLYIEWEDFLQANRFRDRSFSDFSTLAYMGETAGTANDLFLCKKELAGSLRLHQTKLPAVEKEKRLAAHFGLNKRRLDSLYACGAIGEQARRVEEGTLTCSYVVNIIDLYKRPTTDEDKKAAEGFDDEAFLQPFDLGNPYLFCDPFSYFMINRIEYLPYFRRKSNVLHGVAEMNFPTYVLTNYSEILTPERRRMVDFVKNGVDYNRIKDSVWMKEFHRCTDSVISWGVSYPEIKAGYDKEYGSPPRYRATEIRIKEAEMIKREYADRLKKSIDLTCEAVILSQIVNSKSNKSLSIAEVDTITNAVEAILSTPYLKTELKEFHRRYMEKTTKGYKLGNSKGEEIFKKILEPHRGKVVLVDFWGIFCGPCVAGIEHSVEMRQRMKEQEVAFVFITGERESPKDRYDDFVKKYLADYSTHRLPDDELNYIKAFFDISGIPRYMLVSPEGHILDDAYSMHNFERNSKDLLKQK